MEILEASPLIVENKNPVLKPVRNWETIFLFGIPTALMAFAIYGIWPYLTGLGIPRTDAYAYATSLVTGGMAIAAIIAYFGEGNPLAWSDFASRYRMRPMNRHTWLLTFIGFAVLVLLSFAANAILVAVYRLLHFTMPDITPGVKSIPLSLMMLVFNILGEELWWRGYILPRQEVAYGRYAWAIHGTLWSLFHLFKWWAVPAMMVTCQVVPFIAQRTKNTWPGILIHFLLNGLGILAILLD